jgi:hypothetical protein
MERGDFYASTGVRLRDVGGDGRSVWLSIDGEPGVNYQTEFVGSVAARAGDGQNGSAKVSEQVGVVLASSTELKPVYEFTGREIYVRARVKSSKLHSNPYAEGDYEMAWTQPVAKPAR